MIKEISYRDIEEYFTIQRRQPGPFTNHPGIFKKKDGSGYGIRVVTKTSTNYRTGRTNISWDYFGLDNTGLIIKSPRGHGKYYTKKARIIDIEEGMKEYN